jgi:hypothetical protein
MLDAAPITDPAAERTARHAAILRELAELGMALVRRVVEQASEPEGEAGAVQPDPGLSFSRLSRAVRLTLALEKRLFEETKAAAGPAPADADRFKLRISRKDKVAYAVEGLLMNCEQEYDEDEIERLLEDADERLSDMETEEDFADAPISAIVARICADLGLTPDWTMWAREAWAKAEARDGVAGSPYERSGRAVETPAKSGAPTDPSPSLETVQATGPP